MEFVPLPTTGRRHTGHRRVRLGDAGPHGRLRLDAAARYLQDVAFDDASDAGLESALTWVVRRVAMRIDRLPRVTEEVALTTFCGGTGSRWAERRTSVVGERDGALEAAALWVLIDPATGRPQPLPADFHAAYGEVCAGRRVSSRLELPGPPAGDNVLEERPWPLRFTDVDVLGHVNNAAYWEAVEDEAARVAPDLRVGLAELEHRTAIDPGAQVTLVSRRDADGTLWVWLRSGAGLHASARLTPG